MTTHSLGDALFTKTQQRVLGLLYGRPDRRFFTNEIVRQAAMGRGTVRRELERMAAAGLLLASREGKQLYYQANPQCPIFKELTEMVSKLSFTANHAMREKSVDALLGASHEEVEALAKQHHIRRLVLFGSAARGEMTAQSDIDLLVDFQEGMAPSLGGMVELQDAFSLLFGGRKVDLATSAILRNPYRRQSIEKNMEVLYAA
ncbi:MAG: ArsR family transcriptional regulator [Chromatiales bacterium]|nr:ArsR family transcriptional regulator [Chromatiales bacterium]